jgi:hypothetical protein
MGRGIERKKTQSRSMERVESIDLQEMGKG